MAVQKRNDLERKFLECIVRAGDRGILQSELWRELGTGGREASRIVIRLERKGLIKREKELHKGRWTYRLFSKRRPVSIESVADCPCFLCPNLYPDEQKCGLRGTIRPYDCERLTKWILNLIERAEGSEG